MATGTIKNIRLDKRFGFLRDTDGVERFFHYSAVDPKTNFDALKNGDAVEFDAEDDNPKGPRAKNVRLSARG